MTRTVVITGATGGIGRQSAIALARQGARVVVTGRDPEHGEEGLRAITRESGSSDVDLLLGDLSRRSGVLAIAAELRGRYPRIDALINNAGAVAQSLQRTEAASSSTSRSPSRPRTRLRCSCSPRCWPPARPASSTSVAARLEERSTRRTSRRRRGSAA